MPTDALQVPPQAVEAEMAALGSMLIESSALELGIELLAPDHFYKEANRKVFQAVTNLAQAGQAVDIVTVGEELDRLRWLADVGGKSFLAELTHSVSTAAHVEHYARIVREKAVLRELIRVCTEAVGQCYAEAKEARELLDEVQQRVLNVAQKQALVEFIDAKTLAHEVIDHIERLAQHKQEVIGVPTGIAQFDKMTAGFQKGDLILIAARPSQGKTALALNIAAHVAVRKKLPVAVFSLEMSKQAIMQRLIASEAGVDLQLVRTAYFPKNRWVDLTTAASNISATALAINDTPALSALEVRSFTRRLAADLRARGTPLSLVIIDYLQLMRGSYRRAESRQQEVSDISRSLKQLARDLDLPVVALSQLSRRTEEKGRVDNRPQLSDLRESGALEQDADLVAFIYREGYYKPNDPTLENKAEIIIAKQRNGPTGRIDCVFRRHLARFENMADLPASGEEEEAQVTF